MNVLSLLFWGLVLVTFLVSYRWGSMVGLIFFVFALMTGSLAIAHWPDASHWALYSRALGAL